MALLKMEQVQLNKQLQRFVTKCEWSAVSGQRSAVSGQRSAVSGQKILT